jgi:hypothetical protein
MPGIGPGHANGTFTHVIISEGGLYRKEPVPLFCNINPAVGFISNRTCAVGGQFTAEHAECVEIRIEFSASFLDCPSRIGCALCGETGSNCSIPIEPECVIIDEW